MKILICIDDTDNLDSIGTGELLESLCDELMRLGLARGGFVTRHQLFISDKIAYTSHNSSMCSEAEAQDIEKLLDFSRQFIAENAAEGSDPGLCVYVYDDNDTSSLTRFGLRAQSEVLNKELAFTVAEGYKGTVFLSEHGGDGSGIIGALAGVGLRLTGNDGRIKGKLYPEKEGEILTIKEACEKYSLGQAVNEKTGETVRESDLMRFETVTKAVYKDFMMTLLVNEKDGFWVPNPKKVKGKK